MPFFNLDSVIQEERELDEMGVGRPFRFGYAFDVDYGMEHRKWFEVEDKNIWSIRFKSKDAYTLNFAFSNLSLVPGVELYVFNSNGFMVYGPVKYKQNTTERFNSFGTDLVVGNEVIIQIIKAIAYYGAFHKSWNGGNTNDTRLSVWLAPIILQIINKYNRIM
jgi:hypothetical protein